MVAMVPMMGGRRSSARASSSARLTDTRGVGVVAISGPIVIVYCMSGGIRGAMLTDVIQGLSDGRSPFRGSTWAAASAAINARPGF